MWRGPASSRVDDLRARTESQPRSIWVESSDHVGNKCYSAGSFQSSSPITRQESVRMNEYPGTDSLHAERGRENQRRLGSALKGQYDFVVCGSGSAGSDVAGRLAATPGVQVLLLEAGQTDDT